MATAMLASRGLARMAGLRPARRSRTGCVAVRATLWPNSNRPTWYPGATPPSHLDGSMLADYGFDPLRLGTNPTRLKWLRYGEVYNGQVSMLAVVGILVTELLGRPSFWDAGSLEYALDTKTLVIIEFATWAFVEYQRYVSYQKTGESGFITYPFDPLNMRSDETRVKEIKNGRLAMLAVVGFFSQYAVRGMGPIACLKLHLEDPGKNNIYNTSVGPETCVTVAAICLWPIIIEATKTTATKESVPILPWNEPWAAQEDDSKVVGTEF